MKLLFLLSALIFITPIAYAQQSVSTESTQRSNSQKEGNFLLEMNGKMLGSYDNTSVNAYKLNNMSLALNGRYFIDYHWALTFSLPFFSGIFQSMDQGKFSNEIYSFPVLFGGRYQLPSLGNSNFIRPYFQAEAGMSLLSKYDYKFSYEAITYPQFAARASTGVDVFFGNKIGIYSGIQFGYLMSKDVSNYDLGLNLGYLF